MALGSSDLSLLFRLKAENQASPVIKTAQADISRLTSTTSAQFGQMQNVATQALGRITQSLTSVASQAPVVGSAIGGLSNGLSSLTTTSAGATAGLAALAGAAVIGVAAFGAAVAGIVQLGKTIFDLTRSTAEFQGKFFDLAQKTGFTTETLSTLALAAKTTGSNIDGISGSLVLFEKNMEKARTGQEEMSKKFKQLNIDTVDNEKALREAFTAISRIPEGAQQAATAMSLFGRSGKDVLAIIKETGGNLDETIARFTDLGAVVSSEAAAAADKFNDSLEVLSTQLAGIGRTLTESSIPIFITFFEDVGRYLSGNQESWKEWERVVAGSVAGVLGAIEGLVLYIRSAGNLSLDIAINSSIQSLAQRAGETRATIDAFSVAERAARRAGTGASSGGGGGGGGGKSAGKQDLQFKSEIEASNRITAAQIEDARTLSVALKQAYDLNIVNLEDYYQKRQILIDDNFNAEIDAINREQAALDAALERGRIKKEEAAKKDADLKIRTTKAQNKLEEETNQLNIDRQKALDQVELNRERQLSAIRVAVREGELSRVERLVERHAALESDLLTVRLRQEKEVHDEQMLLLDIELKQITTSAERKAELDNKKIESEQRYTDRIKQLTRERIDVLNEEAAAASPSRVEDPNFSGIGAAIEGLLGPPPEIEAHLDVVGQLRNAYEGLADGIAAGVGQMVQNFVLLGKVGPDAFRKVLASALATVAARAAADAIYELAIGFAALTPWGAAIYGPAALHFKAAALLAGIAVGAGAIGRGVAGGAFADQSSSGSGRSTSTGSKTSSTASPSPLDIDRRAGQPPPIHIHVEGQATEGFKYMVTKVIQDDYRTGGDVYDVIGHAMGKPGFKG